jgi:hypothetical protein
VSETLDCEKIATEREREQGIIIAIMSICCDVVRFAH